MALLGEPAPQPERQDLAAPFRYVPTAPAEPPGRTRRNEETRPCQLRINAVPNAAGSAYLEQGRTKIIATVYGPRQAERDRQARSEGQLFVEMHFAPFCARDFNKEESEKRVVLYNSILQSTLESVILLERYGKTAFDITLLVLEDDGAVLTGSLAAASLALADAKVEMRDLIAGATVYLKPGLPGSPEAAPTLLLDCDRAEEMAMPERSAVLHLGLCPTRGMLCLLHSVGPLPSEPFEQMVLLGKETAEAFGAEMRRCLQEQVQRRAEKKRARSFNELLEVDNFLEEDLAAVVDDGYG